MTLRQILRIETSPFSRELWHAVDVADGLHRCPNMPPIPVVLNSSRTEEGAYHSLSRPSRPVKIEISRFAAYPALTLLHEIGHLLDHMALNPIKRGFGSEHDPLFEPLWKLWDKSGLMRTLRAMLAQMPTTLPKSRRFIRHQMLPSELWAQTYMQWVVSRSRDLLLESQFRAARSETVTVGRHICDFCWEDVEFQVIIKEVDRVFFKVGRL